MTMLMQWLQILVPAAVLWVTAAYSAFHGETPFFQQENPLVQFVLLLPFVAIVVLGIYSVSTVLWRTYNFNDCTEAADELQKEIVEAKEFLVKNKLIEK